VPQNVNKKKKSSLRGGHAGGRGGLAQAKVDGSTASVASRARGGVRGRGQRGRGAGRSGGSSQTSFDGECFVCGESGHRRVDCPVRAEINMIGTSPVDRAVYVRSAELRRGVHITSPLMPGHHSVLLDTGAEFSAISSALASKHKLHIFKPGDGETKYISLADRSKHVARVGYVVIPLKVHFDGGKHREPVVCRKKLEVLNMSYDFILGVDILPQLFPTDDIMDFLVRPAPITDEAVIVDEKSEGRRFGKQIMTFGLKERVNKVDSDACLDDYVSDRLSFNINKRFETMFDNDLPDMFSRINQNLRAASLSARSDNVSVTLDMNHGHHLRSVTVSSSASIASASASD
jgi:hypothetical protein